MSRAPLIIRIGVEGASKAAAMLRLVRPVPPPVCSACGRELARDVVVGRLNAHVIPTPDRYRDVVAVTLCGPIVEEADRG